VVHRQIRASGARGLILAAALSLGASFAALGEPSRPATIERIKPSVVAVGSFERLRNPQFAFAGTGFVVGDGTLVATNEHVVAKLITPEGRGVLSIAVRTAGGVRVRTAKMLAADSAVDLALLRVEGPPLPVLFLGDSGKVREGETYLLTGFPIGAVLGLFPVTHQAMIASITPIAIPAPRAGRLDARTVRRLGAGAYRVFQLDAVAYPGNSGSPVYHPETGAVVAIVNSVFVKATKESLLAQPSGITYAIPAQKLQELLDGVR
jgi:S1-C subfamily serine protease